ncbi:hypothetical protein CEXT_549481 [Caerostris extrusa]|uniref:Uncharacterized protein n=1 Tax=Caerostris extrusa TaxID=172846 RepID=A0AAV4XVD8_CAEEX|nr:hypothetical protein CEXT_549481 [Caerostris extrusa]
MFYLLEFHIKRYQWDIFPTVDTVQMKYFSPSEFSLPVLKRFLFCKEIKNCPTVENLKDGMLFFSFLATYPIPPIGIKISKHTAYLRDGKTVYRDENPECLKRNVLQEKCLSLYP